jgi:hypothetical protein
MHQRMSMLARFCALFSSAALLSLSNLQFPFMQPLAWVFVTVFFITILILWNAHQDEAISMIVMLLSLVFCGVVIGAMLW